MQGCDGSVLLNGSASGPSEQDAPPNFSLRAKGFQIIDDLRRRVHKECGRIVSCSDIVALAARDSVYLVIKLLFFFFCLISFFTKKKKKKELFFVGGGGRGTDKTDHNNLCIRSEKVDR